MLTLHFEGVSAIYSFSTEPRASFRIDAECITDASGELIAVHEGGFWQARDGSYTRIECAGPVVVTRTGTEQRVRMFDQVSIVGGSIQADGRYVAILSDAVGWLDYKSLKPIGDIMLSVPPA